MRGLNLVRSRLFQAVSEPDYDLRGERGLFSFAMVVWLGIQQLLGGNSLRKALKDLIARAKASRGDRFLLARLKQNILAKRIFLSSTLALFWLSE